MLLSSKTPRNWTCVNTLRWATVGICVGTQCLMNIELNAAHFPLESAGWVLVIRHVQGVLRLHPLSLRKKQDISRIYFLLFFFMGP